MLEKIETSQTWQLIVSNKRLDNATATIQFCHPWQKTVSNKRLSRWITPLKQFIDEYNQPKGHNLSNKRLHSPYTLCMKITAWRFSQSVATFECLQPDEGQSQSFHLFCYREVAAPIYIQSTERPLDFLLRRFALFLQEGGVP